MAALPEATAEGIDVVLLCAENGYNCRRTARMYNERFPGRRPVNHKKISRILSRFRQTGNVTRRKPAGRPRVTTGGQREEQVLQHMRENPHTSTRAAARLVGDLSHMSVCRILKRHKFHPFHVHLHQELRPSDWQQRVDFCNWLDSRLDDDPDFLSDILWSDEASFSRDGNVNTHNAHYWSPVNPHWLRQASHQVRFRANVWCGIRHNTIVGPVFLPPRLSGERYLELLQHDVDDYVSDLPLAVVRRLWFQQDGASCHFLLAVRDHLNTIFPNQWIGRGAPSIAWPPRSPDLTPLDFFLWGFVKDRVYATEPRNLEDLQDRIQQACLEATPEMLSNVRVSLRNRIRACIAAEGRHFEHIVDLN